MVAQMELSKVIIASLIIAMGLIAWGFAALRLPSSDRTPIWFGIFGCLYGVRLAASSQLVQSLFPALFWRQLEAAITYVILVPAGLFVESLFGPGWRKSLRRSWQAAAVCAPLAIAHDLVRGQAGAAMWLNAPVVLTVGGIATAHVVALWWRESWPREFRVAVACGLLFAAVATYQTLGGELELEPPAMLVFMSSVGYLVARRMLASERRLVAVARELDLAREIQQSILPRALPDVPGVRVAARYLPMNDVGGDLYDFDTRQPNRLGVMVADVSGHGVPAALVASMVKIAFAAEADRLGEPGEALANVNRTLCGRFEGAYVTACCCLIDAVGRRLVYANAGHPAPLLCRRDGAVHELDQRGLLLAFDADARYATAEVALAAGDRLVFFSDGVVEACNAVDELFGQQRLERLLAAGSAGTPEQFVNQVIGDLRRWVRPQQGFGDDVTIVVVDVGDGSGSERLATST